MKKILYYTILILLVLGWAAGYFFMHEDGYIHSLLLMAGLVVWFQYVYKLKPVKMSEA